MFCDAHDGRSQLASGLGLVIQMRCSQRKHVTSEAEVQGRIAHDMRSIALARILSDGAGAASAARIDMRVIANAVATVGRPPSKTQGSKRKRKRGVRLAQSQQVRRERWIVSRKAKMAGNSSHAAAASGSAAAAHLQRLTHSKQWMQRSQSRLPSLRQQRRMQRLTCLQLRIIRSQLPRSPLQQRRIRARHRQHLEQWMATTWWTSRLRRRTGWQQQ